MMTPERVRCPPAFPQLPAASCQALSSARARPTFATDDDTRESTMPSGLSPSYQQRAVGHVPPHQQNHRLQQVALFAGGYHVPSASSRITKLSGACPSTPAKPPLAESSPVCGRVPWTFSFGHTHLCASLHCFLVLVCACSSMRASSC
jgi:hypothetical protein